MVKKTDFNSNISEVEDKIPSITGLATNSALAAVENEIPDVGGFVKKTEKLLKLKIRLITIILTNILLL